MTDITVTQADWEAMRSIRWTALIEDEQAVVQAFAAHRIAAIEDAAKVAERIADRPTLAVYFATAIRALTNQPHNQEG